MGRIVAIIELVVAIYLVYIGVAYRKDFNDLYTLKGLCKAMEDRETLLIKQYNKLSCEKSELEKENLLLHRQLSAKKEAPNEKSKTRLQG